MHPMNTPPSPQPTPQPRDAAEAFQMRRLILLREEMSDLHARLVYLQLMLRLGVTR